jgi:hypothetical protein
MRESKKPQPLDPSQLRTIGEDLAHLGTWGPLTEHDVARRGSSILRRLIVEGWLQRAWKVAGFQHEPMIPAFDLNAAYGKHRDEIQIALAGGLPETQGWVGHGFVMSVGREPPDRDADRARINQNFPLQQFRSSASAFVGSATISREDVIRYYANIAGGVHLQVSASIRRQEEALMKRIQPLIGRIEVSKRDGIDHELLSIGYLLGHAPDCMKLRVALLGSGPPAPYLVKLSPRTKSVQSGAGFRPTTKKPVFAGEGDTTFVCGNCGHVVAENVDLFQISGLYVICRECATIVDFPPWPDELEKPRGYGVMSAGMISRMDSTVHIKSGRYMMGPG